jgi:hypothetical protein
MAMGNCVDIGSGVNSVSGSPISVDAVPSSSGSATRYARYWRIDNGVVRNAACARHARPETETWCRQEHYAKRPHRFAKKAKNLVALDRTRNIEDRRSFGAGVRKPQGLGLDDGLARCGEYGHAESLWRDSVCCVRLTAWYRSRSESSRWHERRCSSKLHAQELSVRQSEQLVRLRS